MAGSLVYYSHPLSLGCGVSGGWHLTPDMAPSLATATHPASCAVCLVCTDTPPIRDAGPVNRDYPDNPDRATNLGAVLC